MADELHGCRSREEDHGQRRRSGTRCACRDRFADRARARDPCLRAPVVEVRRRQGDGDPGPVRSERDPLLPDPERPDRPPRGARPRPDARQATPAPAHNPAAPPLGSALRHRRLTVRDETDPIAPPRLGPEQDWAFPPVEPAEQLPAWASRLPSGPSRPAVGARLVPPVEPEPSAMPAEAPDEGEPVDAEPPSAGVLPVPRRRATGEPVSPLRALAGAAVAVAGVLLGIGALLWATDAPKGSPALQQTQAQSSVLKTSPAPSLLPSPSPEPTTAVPAPLTSPSALPSPAAAPKIALTVLNNSNVNQLAHRAAAKYRAKGWPIKLEGAFRGRIPVTTVYYASGRLASAQLLQKEFP